MHILAHSTYSSSGFFPSTELLDCCLKLGDNHPHTLESLKNLIELYEAWGKPEKAEEWREKRFFRVMSRRSCIKKDMALHLMEKFER
jgi:hypothetical protein